MPDELTDQQWRRITELLAAALTLPGEERREYLDRECAGDAALREELESLLAAHDRAGLLDRPIALAIDDATLTTTGLAAGARIGQYEIQERLGAGGMGVVYRARDRRLGRTIALKFLPPALSADESAKRRFLTEARAAAMLQHANVCTVHEIGETEEGQSFIAMAFVEGESLRHALARGALPVRRAGDIAIQLAAALQCAHDHGVVHRDVKPANVMLGVDGVVKLVDFGVARLEESTVTGAGATPGTVAYMSPEQLRGEDVDHRADLWSLGVVLHEMLAGAHPFRGPSDVATMHAILSAAPPRLRAIRPAVPAALERVVTRALARQRERRFQSADEMREALLRAVPDVDAAHVRPRRMRRLMASLAVAVALLSVLGATVGVPAWRRAAADRARASLPGIERLADERRYVEAYDLLARAERALPGDTTVQRLMPLVADRITVISHPAGAEVWLRRVADDGSLAPDSILAGVTPLQPIRLARADYRVDVRKEGFASVARIASSALSRAEASFGVPIAVAVEVTLPARRAVPPDMVPVPGSRYALVGRGAPVHDSVSLADFLIDAHEVTNEQYREFVAAGGYADRRWWRYPIVLDGRVLSWREAMQRFVDRTGLPGPRGWSGQEFPPGQGRHPVTGVTWHEAAAYAAFVGKRLPTIYEWEKAARDGRYTHFEGMVVPWGLVEPGRGVARRANFGGSGTVPVGSYPAGISPFGAHDMAGNAEEWVANQSGEQRFVTGGGWDDPIYVFADFLRVSALHSAPSLGFRTALSAGANGASSGSGAQEIPAGAATPAYRPVDDRTYRSLLRYYEYDHNPLDARVVERTITRDWTRETIEIAGPWRDRTVVYLYLPNRAARPLQTLVFVPGSNTFYEATVTGEAERLLGPHIRAGRAVLTVLMRGMVGRPWEAGRSAPATNSVQFRQELVAHATELRRAVDYLETRPDIDARRLAYVAVSFGAGSRLGFLTVEPRFRSAVLIGGGFDERYANALPEARSVNFAPHIGAPTLLLNGRYDEEHPWDPSGLPLWRLLPEPKRLALVEGGHIPPAESRVPVIEAWLDETLGKLR